MSVGSSYAGKQGLIITHNSYIIQGSMFKELNYDY